MTIPTPVEISDATLAFPASALKFMPKWEDIPEEFRKHEASARPWLEFQRTWFGLGLDENIFRFIPAAIDGQRLDGNMIVRQLSAIQGSFAPKHEHKEAAVAYLASLWMESLIFAKPGASLEEATVAGVHTLEEWIQHFQSDGQQDQT